MLVAIQQHKDELDNSLPKSLQEFNHALAIDSADDEPVRSSCSGKWQGLRPKLRAIDDGNQAYRDQTSGSECDSSRPLVAIHFITRENMTKSNARTKQMRPFSARYLM